jgi:hypothetical protein
VAVVGFTTTYAIIAYCHQPRRGVLDTTLRDKVCQSLSAGGWFLKVLRFPPPIKIDRHDITELLLKVALNTIIL